MKSRTSFFNRTVLKKDITRFAPVWALYTLFLIVLFLTGQREDPTLTANGVVNAMSEMPLFHLIYGGLTANILFGDLFQSRMCNALHALPLRRESWFLTHVLSGLLFGIVPSLVGAVFLMFLLQEYFYIALLWLAVTVLQYLFFFGLGVFSVMCAGNRLGMAAVYAIMNLFSLLVYVLAKLVYEPLLFGFEMVLKPFQFFCPVAQMTSENLLYFNYDYVDGQFINGRIDHFNPEVWVYLFVVAAIGVILTALSLLLYRKRKLECAGDFVAFRGLAPVFLVICTLACGVFLFAMSSVFGFAVDYALMAIGVLVGFFAGAMLLERTVRVFHKKNFLRFAALVLILTASLIVTKMDPLRITWYAPEAEEIACMRIYRDNDHRIYEDMDNACYQLETAEEIAAFRQVHTQLMADRDHKTDGASHLYVHYWLNNGREVKRYYTIDEHTPAYDTLRMYFSDYRYIFNVSDWNAVANKFTCIDVSLNRVYPEVTGDTPVAQELESMQITDPKMIAQFMEAVKKDCDAGNMAQAYTFHIREESFGWFYLSSNVTDDEGTIIRNGDIFKDLTIYPSAVHTQAVVEQWAAEQAKADS